MVVRGNNGNRITNDTQNTHASKLTQKIRFDGYDPVT